MLACAALMALRIRCISPAISRRIWPIFCGSFLCGQSCCVLTICVWRLGRPRGLCRHAVSRQRIREAARKPKAAIRSDRCTLAHCDWNSANPWSATCVHIAHLHFCWETFTFARAHEKNFHDAGHKWRTFSLPQFVLDDTLHRSRWWRSCKYATPRNELLRCFIRPRSIIASRFLVQSTVP